MTEKRLIVRDGDYAWVDTVTDTVIEVEDAFDLVNNLAEENEQLKSELSRYKEVNRLDIWKSSYSSEDALITELQNKCDKKREHIVLLENKIHRMREAIHKLEWLSTHRNADLQRENYKLKSTIKEVTELLSDEVDLFSNEATKHDINAYMELRELDNKDAYYMATATKKAIRMLKELEE